MFERIVTRQPRVPAEVTPPLLASVACHVVVAALLMGALAHAASLVIAEATHPGFDQAVRAAMPRLRFLPAEHRGRRVSQRVQKQFLFRVEVADTLKT